MHCGETKQTPAFNTAISARRRESAIPNIMNIDADVKTGELLDTV